MLNVKLNVWASMQNVTELCIKTEQIKRHKFITNGTLLDNRILITYKNIIKYSDNTTHEIYSLVHLTEQHLIIEFR